jgi:hypothetical protein
MKQGPRGICSMEETGGQKYHRDCPFSYTTHVNILNPVMFGLVWSGCCNEAIKRGDEASNVGCGVRFRGSEN